MTFATERLIRPRTTEWERYFNQRLPGETPHPDDDFFYGRSLGSAWTTLTVSGSQTITVRNGICSVLYNGQSANDVNGILKTMTTTSPPVTIETAVTTVAYQENFSFQGLVFANGSTSGDSIAMLDVGYNGLIDYIRNGTFTNAGAPVGGTAPLQSSTNHPNYGRLYLRLIWRSANTFSASWSGDGVSWTQFEDGDASITLTPSVFGLVWTRWNAGGISISQVGFDYFRVYAADLNP